MHIHTLKPTSLRYYYRKKIHNHWYWHCLILLKITSLSFLGQREKHAWIGALQPHRLQLPQGSLRLSGGWWVCVWRPWCAVPSPAPDCCIMELHQRGGPAFLPQPHVCCCALRPPLDSCRLQFPRLSCSSPLLIATEARWVDLILLLVSFPSNATVCLYTSSIKYFWSGWNACSFLQKLRFDSLRWMVNCIQLIIHPRGFNF